MRKLFVYRNTGFTDFYPITSGIEKCAPLYRYGPCTRPHYLIHFVIEGKGTFINPNNTYTVTRGQAFLIRPHENCTYIADKDDPWHYTWIDFSGVLAKKFDDLGDIFEFDNTIVAELINALNMTTGQEEYLISILFKLYVSLFASNSNQDLVNKTKSYIEAYYTTDLKISDIAKNLNVSRTYLPKKFKETTGTSVKQHLITKRLSEGKKLLDMGYQVSEVADMVGYYDQFNFSKAFKNQYGVSPSGYKKSAHRLKNDSTD